LTEPAEAVTTTASVPNPDAALETVVTAFVEERVVAPFVEERLAAPSVAVSDSAFAAETRVEP